MTDTASSTASDMTCIADQLTDHDLVKCRCNGSWDMKHVCDKTQALCMLDKQNEILSDQYKTLLQQYDQALCRLSYLIAGAGVRLSESTARDASGLEVGYSFCVSRDTCVALRTHVQNLQATRHSYLHTPHGKETESATLFIQSSMLTKASQELTDTFDGIQEQIREILDNRMVYQSIKDLPDDIKTDDIKLTVWRPPQDSDILLPRMSRPPSANASFEAGCRILDNAPATLQSLQFPHATVDQQIGAIQECRALHSGHSSPLALRHLASCLGGTFIDRMPDMACNYLTEQEDEERRTVVRTPEHIETITASRGSAPYDFKQKSDNALTLFQDTLICAEKLAGCLHAVEQQVSPGQQQTISSGAATRAPM